MYVIRIKGIRGEIRSHYDPLRLRSNPNNPNNPYNNPYDNLYDNPYINPDISGYNV